MVEPDQNSRKVPITIRSVAAPNSLSISLIWLSHKSQYAAASTARASTKPTMRAHSGIRDVTLASACSASRSPTLRRDTNMTFMTSAAANRIAKQMRVFTSALVLTTNV